MQDTCTINYWGYFTPLGGYGISNLNWVKWLERKGIKIIPNGKFSPRPGTKEYDMLDDEERNIIDRAFYKQELGIIETTPFNFHIIDNDKKIASTMCETNRIADGWAGACDPMDIVVLPNEFNKRVFVESGVNPDKVRVIRPGIDYDRFPYYKRPVRDVYTFGIVGYMNDRKSVFEVIQAFCSEFESWEPVRLYIKSSNKDFGYYCNWSDDRITVDIRHLSPEDLYEVYKLFDCFVFPSKAEGVGMPPREAMCTGLPCIVMNYSGLEEISDKRYAYVIEPKELKEGMNPVHQQPGAWATVDVQELMYWMRYAFTHPEESALMGERASGWMQSHFSWDRASDNMVKLIKELI